MSLDPTAIRDALVTYAQQTGLFQTVLGHEAGSPAPNGLTCDVMLGPLEAVAARSGLATVSVRVTAFLRVYLPVNPKPFDAMDPKILDAAGQLFNAFIGGFTLGGLISHVDILGDTGGPALNARPGWLPMGENRYRVTTLTVPLILDDVYGEAA